MKTFEELDDYQTIFWVGNVCSMSDNIQALALSHALYGLTCDSCPNAWFEKIGMSNSCPESPPRFDVEILDRTTRDCYEGFLEVFLEKKKNGTLCWKDFFTANNMWSEPYLSTIDAFYE